MGASKSKNEETKSNWSGNISYAGYRFEVYVHTSSQYNQRAEVCISMFVHNYLDTILDTGGAKPSKASESKGVSDQGERKWTLVQR